MSDYGYLNARVRAMKTRLLGKAGLEALSRAESVAQLTTELLSTTYKSDLEWGRLRQPGIAGLEEGLRRHVVLTVRKVARYAADNQEAAALWRILVARWDVHNLRTLLRGQHISAPPSEIRESLLPVGGLDESQLEELSVQPSLKAVIDLLVMWGDPYARPLLAGYPDYAKTRELSRLELRLDQFHYHYLVEMTRRRFPGSYLLSTFIHRRPVTRSISRGGTLSVALVREVVRREIDVVNIVTLLRLTREGLPPLQCTPFFIPGGGALTTEGFVNLVGKGIDALIGGLARTPYARVLEAGLPLFRQQGAISVLERRLEEYLVSRAVALFRGDLLSSAVMIAYLSAKFNELTNLRLLARGKEAKMPESRIREALILV